MTTDDMERLEVCLEFLTENKNKERHDYAALYGVAKRIVDLEDAPDALKEKAAKAMEVVEALAQAHVDALEIPEKGAFDGGAWIGHLPVFLRSFRGVPACEALREEWEKLLERHQKDGGKHLRKYWPALEKGEGKEAFLAGWAALEKAFLWFPCWDRQFRANLAAWREQARDLGLRRGDTRDYDAFIEEFEDALKDGLKAFDRINKKVGRF
ncbi:MAG: hypothetical protein ACYTG6_01580 [Planctomycetota bacterium]|jgi:hypothetical protein